MMRVLFFPRHTRACTVDNVCLFLDSYETYLLALGDAMFGLDHIALHDGTDVVKIQPCNCRPRKDTPLYMPTHTKA